MASIMQIMPFRKLPRGYLLHGLFLCGNSQVPKRCPKLFFRGETIGL